MLKNNCKKVITFMKIIILFQIPNSFPFYIANYCKGKPMCEHNCHGGQKMICLSFLSEQNPK